MTDKEKITEILKAYTKKHNISASSVILEEYAEELLANGVIVQKQGKWVSAPIKDKGYDSKSIPTCTNCGYQSFITYTYCPKCGAKLK